MKRLALSPKLAGLLALVLALSACVQDVPQEAFADVLNKPTIAFAEQTFEGSSPGRRFSDPEPAILWTRYQVESDRLEEAFDDLIAQATADGWEIESTSFDGVGSYVGEKEGAGFFAEIDVSENELSDDHHNLAIFLTTGDAPG